MSRRTATTPPGSIEEARLESVHQKDVQILPVVKDTALVSGELPWVRGVVGPRNSKLR